MLVVVAPTPGGPEALRLVQRPDPVAGLGELLVRVAATAVNRADLLQREGRYAPPPGTTDVLGLECSGVVTALGHSVEGWAVGDEVCAVLPGGGYAELAVVPAAVAMPLPPGLGPVAAGAVPEVFATAFDNLLVRGRLAAGETALVHGGTSGVGTAAIQLARRAGARVITTGGSPGKVAAALALGADAGIDYRAQDLVEEVRALTGGRGADVVLDVVGASYLAAHVALLAVEGRLVVIGLQGGARAELDLGAVLSRRLTVCGSTLRARTVQERIPLMARLVAEVWPGFADGSLRPVVDRVLPLAQVAEAHRIVESGEHVGKVVLIP